MWRPLVDVRDVARAYIACVEADDDKVRGQIFNVIYRNMRISELALRVRATLREHGVTVDIRPDYSYRGVRSYRVSTRKIERVLDFKAVVSVEDAVRDLVEQIRQRRLDNLNDPRTTTSAGCGCSRRPRRFSGTGPLDLRRPGGERRRPPRRRPKPAGATLRAAAPSIIEVWQECGFWLAKMFLCMVRSPILNGKPDAPHGCSRGGTAGRRASNSSSQ